MRLNVKEIEDITDLVELPMNDGFCPVPLFHGTRRYALQVSDEDRRRFYIACDKVISFAKKIVFAEVIDDNELFEYQRTKNNLFLNTVVYMYKTSLYEYGAFYLTTSYTNSLGFSNYAGGELGEWAYFQCIGFEDFNIELSQEIQEAVSVIKEEYEKYHNSEKIVLVYYGVRIEDLCTQQGTPFTENDSDIFEFCVDSDNSRCQYTFRLADTNAYCATVVGEKAIRDGFFVFTQVSDVDKYIKRKKWTFE